MNFQSCSITNTGFSSCSKTFKMYFKCFSKTFARNWKRHEIQSTTTKDVSLDRMIMLLILLKGTNSLLFSISTFYSFSKFFHLLKTSEICKSISFSGKNVMQNLENEFCIKQYVKTLKCIFVLFLNFYIISKWKMEKRI